MYDGAVLCEATTNKFLRVLRADPIRVLLMPMDGVGWPFSRTRKSADEALEENLWQLVPEPLAFEKPDGTIPVAHSSPKAATFADASHQRLFSEMDIAPVLTRAGRSALFKKLKRTDAKLAPSTFYRQLRRYLEGGLTIKALDARWCGGRPRLDRDNLEELALNDAKRACRERALKAQRLGPPKPTDAFQFSTTKADNLRKRAPPKEPTHYEVDRNTLRVFLHYYRRKTTAPTLSLSSLYDEMRDQVFATVNPYGRPEVSGKPAASFPRAAPLPRMPASTTKAEQAKWKASSDGDWAARHGRSCFGAMRKAESRSARFAGARG